jgi:hypothetical protein
MTTQEIEQFERLTTIQCSNGNWNYDPYMHGMANAMILFVAMMKGLEPKYLEAPKKWLSDSADVPVPEPVASDMHTIKTVGIEIKQMPPKLVIPMGMPVEDAINACIKDELVNTNLISDGYHTFGELYDHRIELFIAVLRNKDQMFFSMDGSPMHKGDIWRSKAHSDGSEWEGWFILGMYKAAGEQITYHLPIRKWDECDFAEELDKAPEWDGHTSADVLQRLRTL